MHASQIPVILSEAQRSRRTCIPSTPAQHPPAGHPERSAVRHAVEESPRPHTPASRPRPSLAIICLLLTAILPVSAHAQQAFVGTWQGTLQAEKTYRTVLKFEKDPAGALKTTVYSIDRSGLAIPAKTTVDGASILVNVSAVNVTFAGKLSADNTSITGTWTEGGNPLPLTLVRVTPETAWVIPPPPAPPRMMATDANPAFEVATIKPNDTGAHGMQQLTFDGHQFVVKAGSLVDLISFCYNVQSKQITGAPDWASNQRYDIEAVPDTPGMPSVPQINTMIQKLLAERFQLKFHKEQRDMSAFVIAEGKGPQKPTPTAIGGPGPGFGMHPAPGGITLTARNGTIAEFASFLQNIVLDRPVVDQSGLTGRYDLDITFTPDDSQFNGHPPPLPAPTDNTPTAPSLIEAMQKDAGLKMEVKKTPVDVIVIDHAERYSAN